MGDGCLLPGGCLLQGRCLLRGLSALRGVSSGGCLLRGGVCSALRQPPPGEMATAVDGTHPTGMHSC